MNPLFYLRFPMGNLSGFARSSQDACSILFDLIWFVGLYKKLINNFFFHLHAILAYELQKIFTFIVGDSDLRKLPFIDLCFIAFLLTSYSLGRYEEVSDL